MYLIPDILVFGEFSRADKGELDKATTVNGFIIDEHRFWNAALLPSFTPQNCDSQEMVRCSVCNSVFLMGDFKNHVCTKIKQLRPYLRIVNYPVTEQAERYIIPFQVREHLPKEKSNKKEKSGLANYR